MFRLTGLLVLVSIAGVYAPPSSAWAQDATPRDKKQTEAIQRMQKLLDEQLVDAKQFQTEMPLAKFLAAVERQLPMDKKVSLRIEIEAFDNAADVVATLVRLPPSPAKTSLRSVLASAISKIKTRADYRPGTTDVAITTPDRALYTANYDIRDLIEKPESVKMAGPGWQAFQQNHRLRRAEPSQKAALAVQAVVSAIDQSSAMPPQALEAIEVSNGTRLSIRTNDAHHALVADLLQSFRRLGDVAVIIRAALYEVDQPLYTRVSNFKRLSMEDLEKMEKIFLEGKGQAPKGESVFELLDKQTLVLTGDEVKIDNGLQASFLSRHQAVTCMASPEQVLRGDKGRQAVLEGVSFLASVQVSPDRRFVHLKLTEKATELKGIHKVKLWDGEALKVAAERPMLDESAHSRVEIIPDGGSILVPVHYRPRAAQERKGWWILSITPRIYIEEEEQQFVIFTMKSILPLVVADVLQNPRLKATRDFYGTSGDKRFALHNSDVWSWSNISPNVPGLELTAAKREGNRLLGIRVDKYADSGKDTMVTITLFNAGGNANGAVVGGGTMRYRARSTEKGWSIELVEDP